MGGLGEWESDLELVVVVVVFAFVGVTIGEALAACLSSSEGGFLLVADLKVSVLPLSSGFRLLPTGRCLGRVLVGILFLLFSAVLFTAVSVDVAVHGESVEVQNVKRVIQSGNDSYLNNYFTWLEFNLIICDTMH